MILPIFVMKVGLKQLIRVCHANNDNKNGGGAYVITRRLEDEIRKHGYIFDYITMDEFITTDNPDLDLLPDSVEHSGHFRANRWVGHIKLPFYAYSNFKKCHYLQALPEIKQLHVIKGKGKRDISSDTKELFDKIEFHWDTSSSFFYWIDTQKTIAVGGNILSNFTLDYGRVISGALNSLADRAVKVGGIYGERVQQLKSAVELLNRGTCK